MDCKFAEANLVDFYFKDLSAEDTGLIENHLIQCKHCQNLYQQISAVMSSAKSIHDLKAPDFIETRIIARLENKQNKPSWQRVLQYFLRPAMVLSLAVLGILVGIKICNILPDYSAEVKVTNENSIQLAKQFANEDYLITPGDELIESYINTKE